MCRSLVFHSLDVSVALLASFTTCRYVRATNIGKKLSILARNIADVWDQNWPPRQVTDFVGLHLPFALLRHFGKFVAARSPRFLKATMQY